MTADLGMQCLVYFGKRCENNLKHWVPEGSLAGICWCHEMALELVCGADFWCNRHCKTSPVDLEAEKPAQKTPARLPSGTQNMKQDREATKHGHDGSCARDREFHPKCPALSIAWLSRT